MPRQKLIDFRSDMLGRRSDRIIAAMLAAASDPPCMDDREDPHRRALEERAADLLGFEDALFLPTCTMANQIVVRHLSASHAPIVADRASHLVQREASAATQYHGASLQIVDARNGHLSPSDVSGALASAPPRAGNAPRLGIWLEETHNSAGGTVIPAGWFAEIADQCRSSSAWLHLDGARIWNAAVARQQPPRDLTKGADSLAVSLNKCLDAPLGGLLLGASSFIAWAREARTNMGGRWRPIGILAAAAIAALDDFAHRIAAIHLRARRFHAMLAESLPGIIGETPETNIVMLTLAEPAQVAPFLARLRSLGVDAFDYGSGRVRLVLHSGIGDADLDRAVKAIRESIAGSNPG